MKKLITTLLATTMLVGSMAPASAVIFNSDNSCSDQFENVSRFNPTELSDYQKCVVNANYADKNSGSIGEIVWVRVGEEIVSLTKKSIREAGDPVAYIEQAIHDSIVAQMQAQIEEINAANDEATEAFESEIDELTQDLAEKSMELLGALDEIEGLETQVADLETTIEGLETDVDDLNDDVADLKSEKEGLETEVSGLKSQIDDLNDDVDDLQAKLDTAIAENAELQATIAEKNADIATLEGTLEATKASLATTEANLATAEADLATAEAALEAEQAAHEITKGTLNDTVAEKNELQTDLNDLKDEIENASLSGEANDDGTKHVVSVTINGVKIKIEADFTTNAPSADDISAALGISSKDSYNHTLPSGPVASAEITDQPNDKIKMTVTIEGVTLNGYIWTDKNNESIIESIKNQITTIAQQSYTDGYEAGYKEGYNDGYTDGYTDGYAGGFEDGVASVK